MDHITIAFLAFASGTLFGVLFVGLPILDILIERSERHVRR